MLKIVYVCQFGQIECHCDIFGMIYSAKNVDVIEKHNCTFIETEISHFVLMAMSLR